MPSWAPADAGGPGGPTSGGGGGGSRAPGAPGAAAGQTGGRGGIPIDFRRGRTAKKALEIVWTYPVYKPVTPERKPGEQRTVATEAERALPVAQAYAYVADGDRRPLLVLRECERCKGTDHALLSRTLDNEQTVLLTHWFRCVKLPTNVVDDKHPFHALFQRQKEGEKIPHLFFADPDGSNKRELPGDQPQAVLWETMFTYLERCYAEDAKQAIKELRQLMSQYDKVDGLEIEVKTRIDKEIEKNGPESPKLKKLDADLKKLQKEREEMKKREKDLRELAFRANVAPPKPAAPAAGEAPAGTK